MKSVFLILSGASRCCVDFRDSTDYSKVKDYLAWQAPWLLQLDSYDDEMRRAIEAHAWQRPLLCASQYQQFPKVLDEQQLKVVRVQARLMG